MADTSEKVAREAMEKSRIDVIEAEAEIKIIKDALKSLAGGQFSSDGGSSQNRLDVSVHKIKSAASVGGENSDDSSADDVSFKVHLSSPIEERTITKLFDPLNPTADEGQAKFESVETSNALLTVEAYNKADLVSKLGVSAPHDLLPLCEDNKLWIKGGGKKTSTLEIAIVAEKGGSDTTAAAAVEKADSESWEDAVEEIEKEEGGGDDKPKEGEKDASFSTPRSRTSITDETTDVKSPQDESKSVAVELQLPIYTVTLRLEYTPSSDDRRDALYEALNEVSKRKVAAIESLRKNAGLVNRAKTAEAGSSSESSSSGVLTKPSTPAVKSGFLNKSAKPKEIPFYKRWYDKTIGPTSMLWVVGPIAKNYVIFAGISLFIHWKGDLLSLPPPV